MKNNDMIFLSFIDSNEKYTFHNLNRLAGKQGTKDIEKAINEGMLEKCEKNHYGETLYKITVKGKKYCE